MCPRPAWAGGSARGGVSSGFLSCPGRRADRRRGLGERAFHWVRSIDRCDARDGGSGLHHAVRPHPAWPGSAAHCGLFHSLFGALCCWCLGRARHRGTGIAGRARSAPGSAGLSAVSTRARAAGPVRRSGRAASERGGLVMPASMTCRNSVGSTRALNQRSG